MEGDNSENQNKSDNKDKKIDRIKLFRSIAIIEGCIIILIAAVFYLNLHNQSYCQKIVYDNKYDNKECLLSSKIYTGIIKPENYLIINFQSLKKNIQDYINLKKINASVYVVNLRDSASMGINEDEYYDAVSLNKLMLAMIILKKVESGKLSLTTLLPISPGDRDDLSGNLYKTDANFISVNESLIHMLSESDNTAFNILSKQVTIEDGRKIIGYLDYYKDSSFNGSAQPSDFKVTTKTVGNMFLSLYLSTAMQPEHSEMILKLLVNNTYDIKKYANLSEDVIISQKFGSFHLLKRDLFHSCGIIYVKDSRVMYCIMTSGLSEEKGQKVVGDIVNKIYTFILEGRKIQNINV